MKTGIVLFLLALLSIPSAFGHGLVPTDVFLSETFYHRPGFGDSMAGGDSVGGGDTIDSRRHTAWFYGDEPIDSCFHVAKNFGLNPSLVESQILEVVGLWQNYFQSKKVGHSMPAEERINTNIALKKKCVGGEDLVFYFGTGPIFQNLLDLKSRQRFSRPVAYVNKTHIARKLNWSKGYLRFVEPAIYHLRDNIYFPEWSKGHALRNVLLHEIGHVFGFVHTPGTIMKKEISMNHFVNESEINQKQPIDGEQELFPCLSCPTHYEAEGTNPFDIHRIEISPSDELTFLTSVDSSSPVIQSKILNPPSHNLLSFFAYPTYKTQSTRLYFVDWRSHHFQIEKSHKKLILRRQGAVVGQFTQEEI